MNALRFPALAAFCVAFAVGVAGGCVVNLGDELTYSCTTDSDCGGNGFVCAAPSGGAGRCCQNAGVETCNKKDDDCNGVVDDIKATESCNGVDDDCDGKIDEDFNFLQDGLNCGACGKVCTSGQSCTNGVCIIRNEVSCNDGIDNDNNGKKDCEEPACNLQICGPGCKCKAFKKTEENCNNSGDDDGDGKIDCADEDCGGAGCGVGCLCSGLARKETACGDDTDNDGDMKKDCDDTDCAAQLCSPVPDGGVRATLTCSGVTCKCNGGNSVNETNTGALCRDKVDNDCDGLTDCAEASCNNQNCEADGGAGCKCFAGAATEFNCIDRQDNDGDFATDCADMLPDGGGDCAVGVACSFLLNSFPTRGACEIDKLCHLSDAGIEGVCNDLLDGDGDGLIDCAETLPDAGGDCAAGVACRTASGTGTCKKTGVCSSP